MVPFLPLTALLLTATVSALPHPDKRWARPVVDLGYATYQGVYNETTNIQSFKGMRYAAAPVGDLRWAAPQSPASVSGVQDASNYGNICLQGTVGAGADSPVNGVLSAATSSFPTSSEDCLFVNVFLPPNATVGSGSLPVGVYIHGGGYSFGSGNNYDREFPAAQP
jgi:carboxylesterase type B